MRPLLLKKPVSTLLVNGQKKYVQKVTQIAATKYVVYAEYASAGSVKHSGICCRNNISRPN